MPGYFAALMSAGLSYESLPTFRPGSFFGKWWPWLSALPQLLLRIRNARRSGLRPIIYSHVGAIPSMFREMITMATARAAGARAIVHVHAMHMDAYMSQLVTRQAVRLFLAPADSIIALTPWWKKRFIEGGVDRNLSAVPNPLPPELEIEAKSEYVEKQETATITVLIMTRLIAGKGADITIKALARTPSNVRLLIAGDGEQLPALQQLTDQLALTDRVRFAGWVSGDKKTELLKAADIFCLPTTNDVFPICVVEAMAYGIPVISTRWGGIPDIIDDGEVGFLCSPNSVTEVSDALTELTNRDLRITMGNKAKQHVLRLCGTENVGKQLAQIIESLQP